MNIHDFEFALFIQDQAANSEVLQSRKVFKSLGEQCDVIILMRRKDKKSSERNWKTCVQTIHVMLFLVQEEQNNDFGVKQFNKPFVYKDILLSANFSNDTHEILPAWLSSSLRDGLFDCYYRCTLPIKLNETTVEYASLLEGNELPSFLLQAIIKPCPSHLSQPQILHQSRTLPAFPSLLSADHPLCHQLLTLSLLDDSSNPTDHTSLNHPVALHNPLVLRASGCNGNLLLSFENHEDVAITVRTVTSFITDIVFNETPRVVGKDVMLISSVVLLLFPHHQTNLPKHSPSISSDILLSSTPPPAPVQLAKQDSLPVEMHLEYTQSHTSASGTLDVTERCECDVFVHLCVEWEHPSSPLPIMHEYEWPLCGRMSLSVQVRLHPKSQIEIRYCIDSEMKLLQSSWQPSAQAFSISLGTLGTFHNNTVEIASSDDVLCNCANVCVEELLPHSKSAFSVLLVPQIPGTVVLPSLSCVDEKGKVIPTLHTLQTVNVIPVY